VNTKEVDIITEAVIKKISEKYILVEKTFNLDTTYAEDKQARLNVFIENITTITCKYFRVDKDTMMAQEKIKSEFYKSCWCIGYLCKELPETPISQAAVGRFFNKNHATINHWQKMAESCMLRNFEFKYDVNEVKKLVEQSLKL
jgi:chromosomal replication initiation ATPase DnaA